MAKVDRPRYGVKVEYKNGAKTTFWYHSQEEQTRKHAQLNQDPAVQTARRTDR